MFTLSMLIGMIDKSTHHKQTNQGGKMQGKRVKISSTEIADKFSLIHRDVIRVIKRILSEDYNSSMWFSESSYTSSQNKSIKSYDMTYEGFCLVTDTWRFSRGEWAKVKASLMGEFGESCVVLSSVRTRPEDDFYNLLSGILWNIKIIRQYPICGFRVDFYIPSAGLFIEYDEEQHFSSKHRDADAVRWSEIQSRLLSEFDNEGVVIRVKKGDELKGIASIIGYLALNSANATLITNLHEMI